MHTITHLKAPTPKLFGAVAMATVIMASCASDTETAAPSSLLPPTTSTISTITAAPTVEPTLLNDVDFDGPLPGGTYAFDADLDHDTGPRFVFIVDAPGWGPWPRGVMKLTDDVKAGMSFGEIWGVHVDPCHNNLGYRRTPVATVDDVVAALVDLPGFIVTSPPAAVTIDGYSGTHLELTVDPKLDFETCDGGEVDSWAMSGFTRYHQGPGQIEELWILDVDGEQVFFGAMHFPDTPPDHVAELRRMIKSVHIDRVGA
jgi:hypothetical protein